MNERAVNVEDARDIQASIGGDGEAYARLVRRYQDQIVRSLWRFTRDQATCEELVQDVFVEAYYSLRGFKGQAPLLHWLKRIATRVGYGYWRKRARWKDVIEVTSADRLQLAVVDEETITPDEAAEQLHALLGQLPPRDRLVLTLMYVEELSVAEIAALTGWSQSSVKVQAHRARKKVKKLAEQQESSHE